MNLGIVKIVGYVAMAGGIIANIISSKVEEVTRDQKIHEEVEKAVQKRLSQKGS